MRRKVYLIGLDGMMYPMYQRFAREGVIPNLKHLAENGVVTELYSSLPAYTPTNWATMMTGAYPGTHSLLRWYVDLPEPKRAEESINSFVGNAVKAETIFEAAGRSGLKSVAFHYPASSPRRTELLYAVDGFSNPAYGATPFEVTPAITYTNVPGIPRTYRVDLAPAQDWVNLPVSRRPALEFPVLVVTKQEGEERLFYALVVDTGGSGYDSVIICREKDGNTRIANSPPGNWSEWCRDGFLVSGKAQQATFRFKTVELSPDGKRLRFYRSQLVMLDEFCEPGELGRELATKFGPYQEHASIVPNVSGAVDFQTCLEEMEYQSQWVANAGSYMMNEKGCHLFYCHIHMFDYINHRHLSGVDPACPGYDPTTADEHWEIYRQCYMAADRMVATIREAMDDNTCIVVASDHAASPDRRAINIRKFLYDRRKTSTGRRRKSL
jgi:hypothetical protein